MAGVVLGAGAGSRLHPLSGLRPKVLCPVANRPLIDWAIDRVTEVTGAVAVNVHAKPDAMTRHLQGRVELSYESTALGTAGAIGNLRDWLGGRDALIVNGDTWAPIGLQPLLDGWDGERVRVMVAGSDPLHGRSRIVGSLLPWIIAAGISAEPAGLWERVWRAALAEGRLETVNAVGPFVDCATPADYLAANLAALRLGTGSSTLLGRYAVVHASVQDAVIGDGAVVESRLERCVLWPGARVPRNAPLTDAIVAEDRVIILVR